MDELQKERLLNQLMLRNDMVENLYKRWRLNYRVNRCLTSCSQL